MACSPTLPRPSPAQPPRADDTALREAAKLLVAAETPVIVAERYAHDQHGVDLLVQLAETLQAAVVNRRGRMNFPNTHYLNQGGNVVAQADVVLALEVTDNFGLFHNVADQIQRTTTRIARPDAKLITLGSGELFWRSNYQGFGRYYGSDLAMGFYGGFYGFSANVVVTLLISQFVSSGEKRDLTGLVYWDTPHPPRPNRSFLLSPEAMAIAAAILAVFLNIYFW